MIKKLVLALVVLLALAGSVFAQASDPLPWVATPEDFEGTDTLEAHTVWHVELTENDCIKMVIRVADGQASVPDRLRVFAQVGMDRFSKDIYLSEGSTYNECVPVVELGLEDSGNGNPNPRFLFDPNMGPIDDAGLHLHDPGHSTNINVEVFEIGQIVTVTPEPTLEATPDASGWRVCALQADSVTRTMSETRIEFLTASDITFLDMVYGEKRLPVRGDWDPASGRYTVDPEEELPQGADHPSGWFMYYLC